MLSEWYGRAYACVSMHNIQDPTILFNAVRSECVYCIWSCSSLFILFLWPILHIHISLSVCMMEWVCHSGILFFSFLINCGRKKVLLVHAVSYCCLMSTSTMFSWNSIRTHRRARGACLRSHEHNNKSMAVCVCFFFWLLCGHCFWWHFSWRCEWWAMRGRSTFGAIAAELFLYFRPQW